MQTERKDYVPGWLWTPCAIVMLVFCGLFILGISTGLARVADGPDGTPQPRERRRRRAVRAAAPATS